MERLVFTRASRHLVVLDTLMKLECFPLQWTYTAAYYTYRMSEAQLAAGMRNCHLRALTQTLLSTTSRRHAPLSYNGPEHIL